MKVYVYKEYCSEYPYESEMIRVFRNKEHALKFLKDRVEDCFEMPWDEIKKERKLETDEEFKADRVVLGDGDGYAEFWLVEPYNLLEREEKV